MSPRSVRLVLVRAGWLVALPLAPAAGQSSGGGAAPLLIDAREQLAAGDFEASQRLFARSLSLARSKRDSATAYFGQSFAVQQTVESGSLELDRLNELVGGYRTAQRLDSARYFVAGQQNVALLLSAAGQHRRAADEYLAGAGARDTMRPELLLSAGRELVLARESARAVRPLVEAARDSTVAPDAQKLLLRIYAEARDTAALLTLADTLRGSTAPLGAVNEALIASFGGSDDRSLHERHLVVIARNAALLGAGPTDSGSADWGWRDRLVIATRGTTVANAANALVDSYRKRTAEEPYRPIRGVEWWFARDNDRRAAWSSAMRAIGDRYNRAGQTNRAKEFYEAAIGLPDRRLDLGDRWVDLEALPPLAAIYGSESVGATDPGKLENLDQFVQALFSGKGGALAANDLRRIRLFRLTLGTLFARQGRWDGSWHGAIFQLEDTRRITEQLRREDPLRAPHNPPEPFEALATEYRRRGCIGQARTAAREALGEYKRRGMTEDASRVETFVSSLSAATPATQGRCPRPPFRPGGDLQREA